jgi:cell wall-associated NlpC family hydrolase
VDFTQEFQVGVNCPGAAASRSGAASPRLNLADAGCVRVIDAGPVLPVLLVVPAGCAEAGHPGAARAAGSAPICQPPGARRARTGAGPRLPMLLRTRAASRLEARHGSARVFRVAAGIFLYGAFRKIVILGPSAALRRDVRRVLRLFASDREGNAVTGTPRDAGIPPAAAAGARPVRRFLLALLAFSSGAAAAAPIPFTAALGVRDEHLDAEFWVRRAEAAERVFLDAAAIGRRNAELVRADPTVHDLEALPRILDRAAIAAWLQPYAAPPKQPLFDAAGERVPASFLRGVIRNAALQRVPRQRLIATGLVTRRADLRTYPTRLRVFDAPADHDIDRFQESALFPGTPVAVLHESRDRRWWFVASPRYAAWIEKRFVALGDRATVFGYGRRQPYLVVTGAVVRTVHTPEAPQLSELSFDMGVRLPLRTDWPAGQPVNGQDPYTAYVIDLPQRDAAGRLELVPALLPRTADVAAGYLPATPANVLRQGFKFLGERYGWGHRYGGRDCSGFVSEVWRSLGLELPRNTGDQAVATVYDRIAAFTAGTPREQRDAAVARLQVGDLIYVPGHVMMVAGNDRGLTYVIHDTAGVGFLDAGALRRVKLNSVAVTPLEPLMADADLRYIDRITSIQRLLPRAASPSATAQLPAAAQPDLRPDRLMRSNQ